jgi:hypothetical protein
VLDGQRAFTVKQLAVNGEELMASLGIPPGPDVGTILSQLLGAVLDDPTLNVKEKLLEIAGKFYRERIAPGS